MDKVIKPLKEVITVETDIEKDRNINNQKSLQSNCQDLDQEQHVNTNPFQFNSQNVHIVVDDYKKGGIGINSGLARVMTDKINKILNQSRYIRRYRRRLENNIFYNTEKKLINQLTKCLLAEQSRRKLDYAVLKRLKELIYNRVAGLIKKEVFEEKLNLSFKEGGVGFSKNIAKQLTQYFEKLLIQGLEIDSPDH